MGACRAFVHGWNWIASLPPRLSGESPGVLAPGVHPRLFPFDYLAS